MLAAEVAMISKRGKKGLQTFLIVMIIVCLAVPLIVFSSNGSSSSGGCCGCSGCCSGGCCGGGCCGGCCESESYDDTQGDGTDYGEDTGGTSAQPAAPTPTVCETKGLSTTVVDGSFKIRNMSTYYEFTATYSIFACSQKLIYSVFVDGVKNMKVAAGTIPLGSSTEYSRTISSKETPGFEKEYNLFTKMCISVSDASVGSSGEICYDRN